MSASKSWIIIGICHVWYVYLYIKWSVVTTRPNITWYFTHHCIDWRWIQIRVYTHKIHSIPRRPGRPMEWLLWRFRRKWSRYNGTALYIAMCTWDRCVAVCCGVHHDQGQLLNADKPSDDEPPLTTLLVSNVDVIIKAFLGTAQQQSAGYCHVIDHVQHSLLISHADRLFRRGFWGSFREYKAIADADESTYRFIISG